MDSCDDMTTDELIEAVIEFRLDTSFGDGLERDYAAAGMINIGKAVDKMTRDELIAEYTGTCLDVIVDDDKGVNYSVIGRMADLGIHLSEKDRNTLIFIIENASEDEFAQFVDFLKDPEVKDES